MSDRKPFSVAAESVSIAGNSLFPTSGNAADKPSRRGGESGQMARPGEPVAARIPCIFPLNQGFWG